MSPIAQNFRMKNYRLPITIAIVIALLIFIKIKFLSSEEGANPSFQQGKPQPVAVTAYIVKPEKLDNHIFSSGSIIANEEVVLAPEISGKIISINFSEGSNVTRGQLLVKINDADLQAQLKKLIVQEKLADDNEGREKKLLAINGISQMEYDAALTQLNSVRADIEGVKAQLAKTEIRAPFDGVIGLKYVSEGSYINQSSRIASIQQISPIKIDFSIPETYSLLVKKNDTVRFTINGNDTRFVAKIIAIEPKIDESTRTIQIRAQADNRDKKIFPGSFASVELWIARSANAIMIPTEAIIPILKGKKVFIRKNGSAQEALVETGFRNATKVQILKGLSEGDTVITTGIMQLKPGSPLKILSIKES